MIEFPGTPWVAFLCHSFGKWLAAGLTQRHHRGKVEGAGRAFKRGGGANGSMSAPFRGTMVATLY